VATLEARRTQLNAALAAQGTGARISFTHLIGYAVVRRWRLTRSWALLPQLEGTGYRVVPEHVNLGLAVDVERKDGSRGPGRAGAAAGGIHGLPGLPPGLRSPGGEGRTNRLMPDDFAGATVTLTNPGGLGTSASVPRLMAGQGSIIAVGSIAYPPEFTNTPRETLTQLGWGR